MTARKALRLGLTGGIGSGKSTVAAMLQSLGGVVIDADAISRASTSSGGFAINAIRQTFGSDFITPDGALDRDKMRSLVFADAQAKQQLESIIHPLVRAEIDRQSQAIEHGVAVLDLPLLAESQAWQERTDTVWVVDCAPETQIQRVMERNHWARPQVEAVLAAQASREQRLAIADVVIHNDHGTTLTALQNEVTREFTKLRQQNGL